MKVIIPVAGIGSRLKPHTFTTPKPLMEVAGKPILKYIIEDILNIKNNLEFVFVVGHMKKEIINFVNSNFKNIDAKFVEQKVLDGDGGAIKLALENLDLKVDEDILIFFGDILIDFDLMKNLSLIKKDEFGIIFSKKVTQPQHYGIVEVDKFNIIRSIEEKPSNPRSDLALIGTYYFKSSKRLLEELKLLYQKKETVKGEYKLAKVIEKLIITEKIKSNEVKEWFDCGRVEVLLEANKYFLSKVSKNKTKSSNNYIIIPPSYIGKNTKLENCIIGPYASIGDNCNLKNVILKNSIISSGSSIEKEILKSSIVGKEVILKGKESKFNIGEKSEIILE